MRGSWELGSSRDEHRRSHFGKGEARKGYYRRTCENSGPGNGPSRTGVLERAAVASTWGAGWGRFSPSL